MSLPDLVIDSIAESFEKAQDVEWDDDTDVRLVLNQELEELVQSQKKTHQVIQESCERSDRVNQQMQVSELNGKKRWYHRLRRRKKKSETT